MRNLIVLTVLGTALAVTLGACYPLREQPPAQKSLLKCAVCGVEITDKEGLEKHMKEEHKH